MALHVSVIGKDTPACGTILLPCLTVKYAVESRKIANEILVHGSYSKGPIAVYNESHIQVNRTVKFIGVYGVPVITSMELSLFTAFSSEVRGVIVTFINIKFKERVVMDVQNDRFLIFLQDSSLQIINCSFIAVARPILLQCDHICDFIVNNSTFISPTIGSQVDGIGRISVNVNGTHFLGDQERSIIGIKYRTVYAYPIANYLSIRIAHCIFTQFQTAVLLYTSAKFSKIIIKFSSFLKNNNLGKCNPGLASSSVTVANFWLNPKMQSQRTTLLFLAHSSLFRDNFGLEGNGISLRSRYSKLNGIIKNCAFVNNSAWISGGAISLSSNRGQISKVSIVGTYFASNKVMTFPTSRGCAYSSLRPRGSGGALSCIKLPRTIGYELRVTVTKCTFVSNSAAIVGGSIYATDCRVTLQESTISTLSQNPLSMVDGIAIAIRNSGLLYGLKIKVNDLRLQRSIIRIDEEALMNLDSSLSCPVGTIVKSTFAGKAGVYDFLALYCTFCDVNKFNINGSTLKRLRVDNVECKQCPPGAKCQHGIVRPIDNYWGFIDNKNGNVNFVQLPVGYGCTKNYCKRYNSCAKYRSGTMCGTCIKGYTESMLTSKCIRNKDCNLSAFWAMAVILVISYLVFFIYKKTLMTFLTTQLLWCKGKNQTGSRTRECSQRDDRYMLMMLEIEERNPGHDVSSAAGFVKILFYFYQIGALLDVHGREREIVTSIKSSVRNIFNFKLMINSQSPACAMYNMTPIRKVMARGVLICTILVAFILVYIVNRVYKQIKKCKNQYYTRRVKHCFGERVLAALFEMYLLSYMIIAQIVISLLNCKQIGNQRLLYLQGSIKCYQGWQYGLVAVVVVWVVPFWLYVSILPRLIREKRLGTKSFFLGCIFPLFLIIYCLIMIRSWKKRLETSQQVVNCNDSLYDNDEGSTLETLAGNALHQNNEAQNEFISSVHHLLCAPFKDAVNSNNFLSWDGVYIFRRLYIVSVFVFVENPIYKLYIILTGQIIFLTHHVYVKPFKDKLLNLLETGSLVFLVMINAMTLLAVDDFTNGIQEVGEQLLLLEILSWIEAVLHLLVPVLLITTVCALLVSRCLHFAFKALKRLSCALVVTTTLEYS